MRIKYELLAIIAMLGITAALLHPMQLPITSAEAPERSSLEARAPRSADDGSWSAAAQTRAQQRERAIDAERLRLVARGELTAREVTPAELRLIRSGGPLRAASTP